MRSGVRDTCGDGPLEVTTRSHLYHVSMVRGQAQMFMGKLDQYRHSLRTKNPGVHCQPPRTLVDTAILLPRGI